jgi:hypothetical protein
MTLTFGKRSMYQEDLANFERRRENERKLWFPVLEKLGFIGLESAPDEEDYKHVIDAMGYDAQWNYKYFALRTRSEFNRKGEPIHPATLAKWKLQFTMRYARPTGNPVEWNKLFEKDLTLLPDYFVYGWRNQVTGNIHEYIILNVPTLQQLYRAENLNRFRGNQRINTDSRGSTLVYIPIPELLSLPGTSELIVYHSENHPRWRGSEPMNKPL